MSPVARGWVLDGVRVAAGIVSLSGLRVLDDVSMSLSDTRSDASQHASSTVTQRVAATLLRLATKFGQHKEGIIDSGRRWTSILDRDKLATVVASDT